MICSGAAGNRHQPTAKGGWLTECRKLLQRFNEYVLHEIFRILVGDMPKQNPVDQPLVFCIEPAESRAITPLGGTNQRDLRRLRLDSSEHERS
jgi:hypothetical protein